MAKTYFKRSWGEGGERLEEGEYTVGFHRCQFSIADETENEWLQSLRDRYNVPVRSIAWLKGRRKFHRTWIATGERSTGPSCWGSPARTSCPPFGVSVLNMPARGTTHSGCSDWPASSINTWVKCWSGIPPDTSLNKNVTGKPRLWICCS